MFSIVSTVLWDDEVVHKACCFDLFVTFLQGHDNLDFFAHCTMNVGHFVDPMTPWNFPTLYNERGSLCGHRNLLNRLTLTFDHGFNS